MSEVDVFPIVLVGVAFLWSLGNLVYECVRSRLA
jgi:hypothetical protein